MSSKTRQTSIDCYNQIKAEGLLSKLRLRTMNAMLYVAPCTAGELQDYIEKNQIQVKHSWKLLSQLRDLGVLYEKNERQCKITDRVVIEWDFTDRLPVKTNQEPNTKKGRLNATLNAFRELYKNRITASSEDWKKVAELINSI